jgi:predicted ATPase/class 3 adenylate cyclase
VDVGAIEGRTRPPGQLPAGTVTFLFTDIEGSTRLLQGLGDGYPAVLSDHRRLLREAFEAENGHEIATEGDSFFVVFASAPQALRAAVFAQRAIAAHPWPGDASVKVRIGLHTGEGVVSAGTYVGIDVHRAARIAAAGHGGQVLLSDTTRALVEHALPDGVALHDLGRHRLKDIAHPEHLHELRIEGLPADFPPPRSLDARPNNLPQRLTTFVGREEEVAEVRALVRNYRLVTLTGPGGTGKTRVALRAAEAALADFGDGVFFVDLSSLSDPALVSSAVAQVLGLQEQVPKPLGETVTDHLAERELLLVLDNFEQVADAAPAIGEWLAATRRLSVLVTSRVPLHLDGEREYAVPPLELPDPRHLPDLRRLSQYEAVALFIDRARAVRHDFSVTNENAPAVAEICVRLDGLPLAIELAASRVKLLPPQAILSRLGQRLPLLAGGAHNLPERQRTLRGAIDWSHELLDEPERALFARLSVFSGGATIESAEAVCNPNAEVGIETLDGLASLVDKSLVRETETADGDPRFGMLETIREYGRERLRERRDAEETARRHAEHFLALAEEAEPHFLGTEAAAWLDRWEREHDNVRAALGWTIERGESELSLRLAAALWRFWHLRGHLSEGRKWLEDALRTGGGRTAARAKAHIAAGGLAYWQSDKQATARHYEESLALYRELGDRGGQQEALFNLGFVPALAGDLRRAQELFEESLAIARELGDRQGVLQARSALAFSHFLAGNQAKAIGLLEEAVELARELGNLYWLADGLAGLADAYRITGAFDRARDFNSEALRMFREAANPSGTSMVLEQISALESDQGRHARAVRLQGAADAIRHSIGGGPPRPYPYPDVSARAEQALGKDAARQAREEGRAMDIEQAVLYALDES